MSGRGPLTGRSLCGRARQWEGRSGAPQRGTEPSGTTQTSRLPVMTVIKEMPDQVSSYVCKAFEVIKSRAGDKPDKIFDVLYRKKLQYFGYF